MVINTNMSCHYRRPLLSQAFNETFSSLRYRMNVQFRLRMLRPAFQYFSHVVSSGDGINPLLHIVYNTGHEEQKQTKFDFTLTRTSGETLRCFFVDTWKYELRFLELSLEGELHHVSY